MTGQPLDGDAGGFDRRAAEASEEYSNRRARDEEERRELEDWTERVKARIVQDAVNAGVLSQLIMPADLIRLGVEVECLALLIFLLYSQRESSPGPQGRVQEVRKSKCRNF